MKRSTKMENTSTMKFKNNGLALWQYRNEGHANQPYQYMHIVCIMRCIHQILLCPNNYVVSFFVNIAISFQSRGNKTIIIFFNVRKFLAVVIFRLLSIASQFQYHFILMQFKIHFPSHNFFRFDHNIPSKSHGLWLHSHFYSQLTFIDKKCK